MTNQDFDPYHKWLGIPAREQPADHYRLLGVERFEADADVISMAADQRMNFLRQFHNGERAAIAQKLLNEIASARVCLLDASKKITYDKNLESRLAPALDESEISSADLAATLEFSPPEKAPEWPPGPITGSHVATDRNRSEKSSKGSKHRKVPSAARKAKRRILLLSLMSVVTILLFLALLLTIAVSGPTKKKESPKDVSSGQSVASNKTLDPESTDSSLESPIATEPIQKEDEPNDESGDQAESERLKQQAEQKREIEEQRRQADEEAKRQKQAEADRRAQKEEEEKEKRRQQKNHLKNQVDQCIAEAQQIRKSDPQQAIDILEDCSDAVKRAQVPPPFKQQFQRKLTRVQFSIREQLAQEKARQISELKKNEERIRKENPEKYLESLGLVKQRNSWQIEAAGELEKMTKPLQTEIRKYNSRRNAIKTSSKDLEKQENELRSGMTKIEFPGLSRQHNPFKKRKFQDWVLDGMPDYPDAPEPVQRLVEAGRAAFDRYREIHGPGSQRLLQEVHKYQAAKKKLEQDRREIENVVEKLEQMEDRARDFQREIDETKKRLEKDHQYVDEAIKSSGIDFKEVDLKGVRNALKKVNEILEDDLLDSFSDDDRRKD